MSLDLSDTMSELESCIAVNVCYILEVDEIGPGGDTQRNVDTSTVLQDPKSSREFN